MSIYLDNAATTFPKPSQVIEAVERTLRENSANPGRGGHHMSLDAGRMVMECRESLARFFGIMDASRIAFTANATEAINLVAHTWGWMNIGRADAIVLTGTGAPTLRAIPEIARLSGKPVFSSNLCLAWALLREIGHKSALPVWADQSVLIKGWADRLDRR